jgi:hypothetical protein
MRAQDTTPQKNIWNQVEETRLITLLLQNQTYDEIAAAFHNKWLPKTYRAHYNRMVKNYKNHEYDGTEIGDLLSQLET